MKNDSLYVYPTKDRSKAGDEYIVAISPFDAKKRKLGTHGVLVYTHPNLARRREEYSSTPLPISHDFNPRLRVPCKLVLDEKIPRGQIHVDQTLRNCLGIEYEFTHGSPRVEIHPLHLRRWEKATDLISRLVGRRHLFFRVCRAHPSDMEKNICRVSQDNINLLGAKEGESILLVSVVQKGDVFEKRSYKLDAFSMPEDIKEERKREQEKMEPEDPFARYPKPDVILGVKPDVSPILLDHDARSKLDVSGFDVVRARRSLRTTIIREIRDFGLVFFLSLLALTDVLEKTFGLQSIGVVVFSFVLSALVIGIRVVSRNHSDPPPRS
ncbi:MAG: hypothetical protein LGR52_09145 [Candidatus Thiosymbion ectosymbiont of Robbea hypermnestra]|nr:hypothetical protein [Candidatus Thiosymbion ectosymbiont of Robbea hypermnestra]